VERGRRVTPRAVPDAARALSRRASADFLDSAVAATNAALEARRFSCPFFAAKAPRPLRA
jgi:hypothetical protein